jgi:hypothetical protein
MVYVLPVSRLFFFFQRTKATAECLYCACGINEESQEMEDIQIRPSSGQLPKPQIESVKYIDVAVKIGYYYKVHITLPDSLYSVFSSYISVMTIRD